MHSKGRLSWQYGSKRRQLRKSRVRRNIVEDIHVAVVLPSPSASTLPQEPAYLLLVHPS